MKITPVLLVAEIERSMPFWIERMGFEKVAEVPEGERLGFLMLAREGTELMLQTIASAEKDVPQLAPAKGQSTQACLFIVADDFADVLSRLKDYPISLPERTTFYGMREIGVLEPNGHVVIFATRNEV